MVREGRGIVLGGGGLGGFCLRQTSVGEQCQLRKMFYEKNLVKYFTSFLQCIFSQQKIFSALTKVLQQNKHLKMLKMYN